MADKPLPTLDDIPPEDRAEAQAAAKRAGVPIGVWLAMQVHRAAEWKKTGEEGPPPFIPVERGDRRFAFGPGKWAARGEKVDGTRYGSVPARRIRFGIVAESGPVQPVPSWMAGLMDTKVERDETEVDETPSPFAAIGYEQGAPDDEGPSAHSAPHQEHDHGHVQNHGDPTPRAAEPEEDDELVLGTFNVIEGGMQRSQAIAPDPANSSEDPDMDQERLEMLEHRMHGMEKTLEALGDDVRLLQDSLEAQRNTGTAAIKRAVMRLADRLNEIEDIVGPKRAGARPGFFGRLFGRKR